MRRNLTAIALGLLAITGCAHDHSNRNAADDAPCPGARTNSCADPKPNDRVVQGGSPYGGAVVSVPVTPPTSTKLAITQPAATSPAPVAAAPPAPRLPEVLRPRELPVLPTPVNPESGVRPTATRIPDAEPKRAALAPAPATPVLPRPATPTRARDPEPVQTAQVLTGTVEFWRRAQRLRYSPADVEEANGGLVMLVGDPALDRVTEGQRIRVRGFLIPSADRTHPPTFQVQSVKTVD